MKSRMSRIATNAAFIAVGILVCGARPAGAQTVNPDNNHVYQFITAPGITWQTAKAQAEGMSFGGRQGYLATVTSAQESAFIGSQMASAVAANTWLGGFQDTSAPDYSEPGGGWRWVTGESWSYTNWGGVEPNNNDAENRLHIYGELFGNAWNDLNDNPATLGVNVGGFLVEFNEAGTEVVPEPSASLLFLPALFILVFAKCGRPVRPHR